MTFFQQTLVCFCIFLKDLGRKVLFFFRFASGSNLFQNMENRTLLSKLPQEGPGFNFRVDILLKNKKKLLQSEYFVSF